MQLESVIIFSLFQVSFLLGFVLGRSSLVPSSRLPDHRAEIPKNNLETVPSVNQPVELSKKKISIDDSKFVTNFSENLQGNGKTLGNQTIVVDDVSSSVSKLAQLKGNK